MINIVYLSLGSNVGNRFKNIESAIKQLTSHKAIKIISKSSLYESEPLYNCNQNNFYNNVIKITTSLTPQMLLQLCKKIEAIIGRKNINKRNMPRIIDIDIITYNNRIINTENLKIPHPKVFERKFVLLPLNDIDAEFIFPNKKTLTELLNVIEDSSKIIKLNNYKT